MTCMKYYFYKLLFCETKLLFWSYNNGNSKNVISWLLNSIPILVSTTKLPMCVSKSTQLRVLDEVGRISLVVVVRHEYLRASSCTGDCVIPHLSQLDFATTTSLLHRGHPQGRI